MKLSVADIALVCPAFIAAFVAWWGLTPGIVSNLVFVAIVELSLFWLLSRMLSRGIPVALREASRRNCFRLDGTRSRRRTKLEKRAVSKLNSDIMAILMLAALAGNGFAALVYLVVSLAPSGAWNEIVREAPFFAILVLFGSAVAFRFVQAGHNRALKEFADGVNERATRHVRLDESRMQFCFDQELSSHHA